MSHSEQANHSIGTPDRFGQPIAQPLTSTSARNIAPVGKSPDIEQNFPALDRTFPQVVNLIGRLFLCHLGFVDHSRKVGSVTVDRVLGESKFR